jgi:mono/diheme cytochrome c family protein
VPTNSGFSDHAGKLVLLLSITLLAFSIMGEAAKRAAAAAQTKELRNPLARNLRAIKQGKSLFRAACASCHGIDARGGGRGPDLTSGRWTHGGSDAALFRITTQGAPGTQMPPNDLSAEETWMVIAYLERVA